MDNRFQQQFDKDAYNDVIKLNEEIEKEKVSVNPDNKKLQDLYMKQLMRGMMLNTNNYMRNNILNMF